MALLGVVIVLRDLRPELDLADVDLRLVLARGLLLLDLLVLVLRVVEDAADGRLGLGSDLDEVEVPLLRDLQSLGRLHDPDLLALSSISRISGTRMRSLIRVGSRSGGCGSNLRGTGTRRFSVRRGVKLGAALLDRERLINPRSIADAVRGLAPRRSSASERGACPGRPRRGGEATPRAPRPPGLRPRACRAPSAARPHGSCGRPTRRGGRPRRAARRPARRGDLAGVPLWRSASGSTAPGRARARRQLAAGVLEQDPEEALEGADQRAVEHHRPVLGVVGARVDQVEALGEVVELHGAELPGAPQRVAHVHVDLRPVEGAVALVDTYS